MPLQQDLRTDGDQISEPVAAVQHIFPEADIQIDQIGPNPIRPFAARVSDVSHSDDAAVGCRAALEGRLTSLYADEADIRCVATYASELNGRFRADSQSRYDGQGRHGLDENCYAATRCPANGVIAMPEHRASCQCGNLKLSANLDPDICIACNCKACQKRTGSAFATVAYFNKSAVKIEGARTGWARTAESGRDVESFFCPECGTTVYWTLDFRPDHVGVLIGTFDGPKPAPTRVVWSSEKRPWVHFPEDMECFSKGSPTAAT